jgi:serine/threonine protein kinase
MNEYSLMHRDIKPNNLRFLKRYNKAKPGENLIKLIDFGFVENFTNDAFTRYYCGTVGYMCPFLMNLTKGHQERYGPEVDYFSFGVLLYYALTSQKVFNGKNHEEKRKLNKANKIPIDKINNADIDPWAKELIFRCLTTDPAERIKMGEIIAHPYFVTEFD